MLTIGKGNQTQFITGALSWGQVYHNLKSVIKKKYGQVCGQIDTVGTVFSKGHGMTGMTMEHMESFTSSTKAWEPIHLFCSSILCCQLVNICKHIFRRYLQSSADMFWVYPS